MVITIFMTTTFNVFSFLFPPLCFLLDAKRDYRNRNTPHITPPYHPTVSPRKPHRIHPHKCSHPYLFSFFRFFQVSKMPHRISPPVFFSIFHMNSIFKTTPLYPPTRIFFIFSKNRLLKRPHRIPPHVYIQNFIIP